MRGVRKGACAFGERFEVVSVIFENLTAKNCKEVLGELKFCFGAADLNRSFGFATGPRISCRRDEEAGSEQVVHRVNEGCHPGTVKVTCRNLFRFTDFRELQIGFVDAVFFHQFAGVSHRRLGFAGIGGGREREAFADTVKDVLRNVGHVGNW